MPRSHIQARSLATSAAGGDNGGSGGGAANAINTPNYKEWRAQWIAFLEQLFEQGHFSADPGVRYDALAAQPGPMKRAVLSLGRQRADILHSLDPAKLRALVVAGFPVDDRKTKNAHRRLQASIVQGQHLPAGDGGPAEMQDLLRIFVSLAACDARDAALFQPLMAAAVALLPDIRAAAAAEPTPEALAAAAAVQSAPRYMPHKREPGEAPRASSQRRAQSGDAQLPRRQPPGADYSDREAPDQLWYEGPRNGSSRRCSSGGGRGTVAGRGRGRSSGGGRSGYDAGRGRGGRGSGRGGPGFRELWERSKGPSRGKDGSRGGSSRGEGSDGTQE
ncbi:hypothetical protein ABPG77_008288 [Micractinium sp. CCAP 211/92]